VKSGVDEAMGANRPPQGSFSGKLMQINQRPQLMFTVSPSDNQPDATGVGADHVEDIANSRFGTTLCSFQMTWAAEFSRQAKSGQATRMYNFYNCVGHHPGGDGGAFAEHGTVTIKDVTQNRCGNANEPAREA